MLKKISDGISRVWEIMVTMAAVCLTGLLIICAAQVFLRKVIFGGFNWADEAMRYLMVYATFLALPYLVEKRKNITIDLSDVLFSRGNGKKIVAVISEILTLICCAVLIPACFTFIESSSTGFSTAMRLPLWFVYFCMPLGFGCSVIASFNNLVRIFILKEEQ